MASYINFYICHVLLFIFCACLDGKFLGGSVSWTKLPYKGVRFTYRLSFEYGTGPCGTPCLPSSFNRLGTIPPALTSLSWNCTSGCSSPNTTLHNVNYFVTFADPDMGWEQGENLFFHTFTGNGPFQITLDGLEWASDNKKGLLTTTVDLGVRNDTGSPLRPNASPISASLGIVGIQLGCVSTIKIPVDDPDGDTARCRLATSRECRKACTTAPKFEIDESQCTVSFDATSGGFIENKLYRVALMIEDYPGYTILVGSRISSIRKPLNKIPYQFTIKIIKGSSVCSFPQNNFVYPVHKDGFRFSYSGVTKKPLETAFYLQTTSNMTDFALSIPAGMTFSVMPDDKNRTSVQRIKLSLTPDQLFKRGDQWGDSMICVWGVNKSGFMVSEKRCIIAIISDFDECDGAANKCVNNGTCINLFQHWTCKCRHGFKPKDCSHQVTCADFPCKNEGTCSDTGKLYACVCANGFTGPDCEDHLNNTTPLSPFSSCTASTSNIHQRVTEESIIFPIALSIVGSLLGLLGLAAFCCFLAMGANRKQKNKNCTSPELDPNQENTSDVTKNDKDDNNTGTRDATSNNSETKNDEDTISLRDESCKQSDYYVKTSTSFPTNCGSLTAFTIIGSQTKGGLRRLPIPRPSSDHDVSMPDVQEIQSSTSQNIYTTTMCDPLMHRTGVKMSR